MQRNKILVVVFYLGDKMLVETLTSFTRVLGFKFQLYITFQLPIHALPGGCQVMAHVLVPLSSTWETQIESGFCLDKF